MTIPFRTVMTYPQWQEYHLVYQEHIYALYVSGYLQDIKYSPIDWEIQAMVVRLPTYTGPIARHWITKTTLSRHIWFRTPRARAKLTATAAILNLLNPRNSND